jgi:hypothetical protein
MDEALRLLAVIKVSIKENLDVKCSPGRRWRQGQVDHDHSCLIREIGLEEPNMFNKKMFNLLEDDGASHSAS